MKCLIMSSADLVLIERILWLFASMVGALFFAGLLWRAMGDLRVRRAEKNAPRSSVLLAWQRVCFDLCLFMVMLIDTAVALLSFQPGQAQWVILGLIMDKVILVALGVYLAWNRMTVKNAGNAELQSFSRMYGDQTKRQ